jgi:two-component system sensor histidine kinase YesM
MELEKLRLQLNPHFLLNSLNAIHTFIGLGYTGSAREFIRCLATHFRFTLQSNDAFTTAGAEIDFLRSYIRLWELQYPKAIQLTVSLPNYLENYRIPQLVLQNLVENSIKYNFDPRSCLVLNIQFSLLEDQDGKAWFFCLYTDNGSGFPRDFLLSANEPPGEEPDRAHIGMYNIRKRLELLYNGISRIEFSNGDKGGSRISMMLPLGLADPANEGEVQNR